MTAPSVAPGVHKRSIAYPQSKPDGASGLVTFGSASIRTFASEKSGL